MISLKKILKESLIETAPVLSMVLSDEEKEIISNALVGYGKNDLLQDLSKNNFDFTKIGNWEQNKIANIISTCAEYDGSEEERKLYKKLKDYISSRGRDKFGN